MIKNSKILITGGFGFIGGHLANILSEATLSNTIVIFDFNIGQSTTGRDLKLDSNDRITVIQGSILNPEELDSLSDDFDYVIHAAGFLGIEKVAEKQLDTMDINILGTRNCLELIRRQRKNPESLIFSTSEIYGVECSCPSEDYDAVVPTTGKRWCYAASKLAAEYYLKAYIQRYGIRGSIVRPFNVFGPNRYGTNAMTSIINKAIRDEPISVSGDGQQVRSWCSIEDFCTGIIAILEKGDGSGEAFNIGNPENQLTMEELANKIVKITGSSSNIVIQQNSTEDVRLRVPDITKAKRFLGYSPSKDFDTSIAEVADWLKAIKESTS